MHQWTSNFLPAQTGAVAPTRRSTAGRRSAPEHPPVATPSEAAPEDPREWQRRLWMGTLTAGSCFVMACFFMGASPNARLSISDSPTLLGQLFLLLGTMLVWRVLETLNAPVTLASPARIRSAALCLVLTMAASFGPCAWYLVRGR